ncbi:hypothetical protein [Aliiroseovarius sp. PrR006]|uniref:hypothetical protein n=1 Tax=Aliiroseovarius sp. PrR006 TaxID=2706883 RepID=UPI0013D232E3|nr:hypothetical protein [Aliiroseovarius sp. PrR006]NDW53657.1 hypothetical protein [Aliiroseovarius sp. PrR006]
MLDYSPASSGLAPTLGRIKLSDGAKAVRGNFSGAQLEQLRKVHSQMFTSALRWIENKEVAPTNFELAQILTGLVKANTDEAQFAQVLDCIAEKWTCFKSRWLNNLRKVCEAELQAETDAKHRNERAKNVTNQDGYVDLVKYGLTQLKAANSMYSPDIFRHGTELVRLIYVPEEAETHLEILNQKSFNYVLNKQAPYLKEAGENNIISDAAPKVVAETIFSDPLLPVPYLSAMIHVPTFDKEGNLAQNAGYNRGSNLFLDIPPGLKIPNVPSKPTKKQAIEALNKLLYLLSDFPFDGNNRTVNLTTPSPSLANTLALLLTPFCRPLIDGPVPAHLLTKPKRGTGATLLAEVIQIILDGTTEIRPPLTTNEDERRKALFSALQTQKATLLYDNITADIDSPVVASLLTSTKWTDRVLGRSGERTIANNSIAIFTGNNPKFSDELQRRLSLIRIDAKMAKPDQRDGFEIDDLKGYVLEHRGELIAACLTIIAYWRSVGSPELEGKPLASFENWYRTMGGILHSVGVINFQKNRDEISRLAASDDDDPLHQFIQAWYLSANRENSSARLMNMYTTGDGNEEFSLISMVMAEGVVLPVKRDRDADGVLAYNSVSFGKYLGGGVDQYFAIRDAADREIEIKLVNGERDRNGVPWSLVRRN